jgi:hypothetical protein
LRKNKINTQKITQPKNETNSLEQEVHQASIGFKVHLGATLAVSSLLITINMLTVPHFPWSLFPICGMSVGVIIHYFGIRSLSQKVQTENQIAGL